MPAELFADLIREGRAAMALDAERQRLSTFGGRISALREQIPMMQIDRSQAKLFVENYFARQEAAEIANLVASQKL